MSKSIDGPYLLLEALDVIDREADHQVHQDDTSEHDESEEHDPARGW